MLRSLSLGDCHQIADLHLNCLTTNFSGKPGAQILSKYYSIVSEGIHACGYVSESGDQILGYVCGVWDPAGLRRSLIKRFGFQLLLDYVTQVIDKPSAVLDILPRLSPKDELQNEDDDGYELRPIVVDARARGTGTAQELIFRLIDDAASRGFQKIFLYAEEDNLRANFFYKKMGFEQCEKLMRGKKPHYRYERSTVR